MINIVTIDPSLTSTAITVNGYPISIPSEGIALTKSCKYTKWFDIVEDHCDIIPIDTDYNEKKYAKLEIAKLKTFKLIADTVSRCVDNKTIPGYNTICLIEGYSYSSQSGPLIDLVTLGTLIRETMLDKNGVEIVVMSPSTVKKLSAKLTYPPIQKGKKVEYRNNQGLAGGSFQKPDIYKVLTENESFQSDWVCLLRKLEEDILSKKSIPKPIEDINDAVVMYHIVEEEYKNIQDFTKTVKNLREY